MTVVDGRASIVTEVDRTPVGLRDFVVASIRQLLGDPGFRDALPGYLAPEAEGRIALLRRKLEGIANLSGNR
jgi:hypothetical protein